MSSPIIGIDLGTTNSVVAIMEAGQPNVIANNEGRRVTPSVVHYGGGSDEVVVGDLAKRMLVAEPERTVRSAKRLIGRRYSECAAELAPLRFHTEASEKDDVHIVIGSARLTPEAVSARVLAHLRELAESYTGQEVKQAVVTVPAYFNDTQRQATKLAGELAGLDVLRVVNEPTAACLAYGFDKKKAQRVAVFDLGGGTFDLSLMEIDAGVFEVKSTCGDNTLGGDNFDNVLAEYMRAQIQQFSGLDVQGDAKAWQRILETAEKVKCELSTLETTTISLPFIGLVDRQPVHFNHQLSRAQLEQILAKELDRIEGPCRQALADAGWKPRDVEAVLMVGGSTRIPAVRRIAQGVFERELDFSVNPDEAVASGAAILGGVLTGSLQEVLLLDVTPLSLGVSSQGNLFNVLIPRNSSIPCEASKSFTTTRDFQPSVKVSVYQGERKMASENRLLSTFRLENVTPAPKGVPHISVNFRIDANGILEVRATDISTGAQQEVRIESFLATKEESERMMKAAESAMESDQTFLVASAAKLRAGRYQDAVRAMLDESKGISPEDMRDMKETLVRIDIAFHLGDLDMLNVSLRALVETADKQGDAWLAVKVRYNIE